MEQRNGGDAIKSDDPLKVLSAMRGHNSPKKLTVELMSFIRHRFTMAQIELFNSN